MSLPKMIDNSQGIRRVIGLSGGKDSTCLAIRLKELYPDTNWEYICTPTGDELPEMEAHWAKLERLLGKPIQRITLQKKGQVVTLNDLIDQQGTIPNSDLRFCTRMLKIQPTINWIVQQKAKGDKVLLYVGLRADEAERTGIYSDKVQSVFPFREWGWGVREVWTYLREKEVSIPRRTDCARCYAQRIGEWFILWRDYPEIFQSAVKQEKAIGHTFRRPGGDSFPAPLEALAAEFARGRIPRSIKDAQLSLFGDQQDTSCRVCRLRTVAFVDRPDYQPKPGARIDGYRHLLGKVSDRELARQAGLSRSAVRWLRQRAGIAPLQ